MQFNVFFLLRGAGKTLESPIGNNPVECVNLASLLARLAPNLPNGGLGVEVVGVRIVPVEDEEGQR